MSSGSLRVSRVGGVLDELKFEFGKHTSRVWLQAKRPVIGHILGRTSDLVRRIKRKEEISRPCDIVAQKTRGAMPPFG
jgi:hypothetical protein